MHVSLMLAQTLRAAGETCAKIPCGADAARVAFVLGQTESFVRRQNALSEVDVAGFAG
jgi:hypothetical protein